MPNFFFRLNFEAHTSFDISCTTCYITGNVALKMELLVQKTQIKWLFKLLVNLLIRESVNGSL